MTVGILLIAHQGIGEAFLKVLEQTFDYDLPLTFELLPVQSQPLPTLTQQALMACQKIDTGQGVLIITDMYGATPANIAKFVAMQQQKIAVIAGLNLPMLVRLCNYSELTLRSLAEKALSGGKRGILCPKPPPNDAGETLYF